LRVYISATNWWRIEIFNDSDIRQRYLKTALC